MRLLGFVLLLALLSPLAAAQDPSGGAVTLEMETDTLSDLARGESVSVIVVVTNNGPAPLTVEMSLLTASSHWSTALDASTFDLDGGASRDVTLTLVPGQDAASPASFTVRADASQVVGGQSIPVGSDQASLTASALPPSTESGGAGGTDPWKVVAALAVGFFAAFVVVWLATRRTVRLHADGRRFKVNAGSVAVAPVHVRNPTTRDMSVQIRLEGDAAWDPQVFPERLRVRARSEAYLDLQVQAPDEPGAETKVVLVAEPEYQRSRRLAVTFLATEAQ